MQAIPFTVSARTAKLIGMENFSNASGAIIELVKNAYEKKKKTCITIFHKIEKAQEDYEIYIIDNGSGMTKDILNNQWMTIGTDDKLINYKSDKKRIKAGAKGIGRFALNRLGKIAEVYTVPEKQDDLYEGYYWKVDWKNFDIPGTTINQVMAEFDIIPSLSINEKLIPIFSENSKIMEIIKKSSFKHGSFVKITSLNDLWDNKSIDKIYSDLEQLIPPKEQSFFEIYFFSTENTSKYGLVPTVYYDEYDYKLEAHYLSDNKKTLNIEITRNELDIKRLENEYRGVFNLEGMKNFPYRLRDFKSQSIKITQSLNEFKGFYERVNQDLLEKIGEFKFIFYFIKNTNDSDSEKYPYKEITSAVRRAWLEKFGGIKIFRDDFRVRPYGENGDDWLLLGERQAQSPAGAGQRKGGYRIRPNQISGTIFISRITNELFQDKSGREGLQETPAFNVFKNILKEIIHIFEEDRNNIMYCLSELYKATHRKSAKQKAKDVLDDIKKGRKSSENHAQQINDLAEGISAMEEEIEEKEEEIRLLRNLASTGLIISSFAHELDNINDHLVSRTDNLLERLRPYLPENTLPKLPRNAHPYRLIEIIHQEDGKLRQWLNYSIKSLRSDKRKRKNININDYFNDFRDIWYGALQEKLIDLQLINNISTEYYFRCFEIDMDSIFNNLVSNSIYALKTKNNDRKILIKYSIKNNFIEIVFKDNGNGLSKEYQKNPYVIFNSFETSKKDIYGNVTGTGLGLYIVKSVIDQYSGAYIKILEFKNEFSLKIGFKTRG
jgi:signal transduction histidine kinase